MKSTRLDPHGNMKEDTWTKVGEMNPRTRAELIVLWNCWKFKVGREKAVMNADRGRSRRCLRLVNIMEKLSEN